LDERREKFGGVCDADSAVLHLDADHISCLGLGREAFIVRADPHSDLNLSIWRELDSIAEEVHDDLFDSVWVAEIFAERFGEGGICVDDDRDILFRGF
jgi:hypothetical protein